MNHRWPRKKRRGRGRKSILSSAQRISNLGESDARRISFSFSRVASLSRPSEPVTRASFLGAGHKSAKKLRKCRRYWQPGVREGDQTDPSSQSRNRSIQRCRPRYQRPPSFSDFEIKNRVFKSSLNSQAHRRKGGRSFRSSGEFFKARFWKGFRKFSVIWKRISKI